MFDRILIIMFENMYRSYVMKNPFMRGLAEQGIDMTNYFGVMHPSQTNYIASIAGELCNVTDDDRPNPPLPQQTIVDLIERAGLGWKGYMDSYQPLATPWKPSLVPADEYPYVIKHDPFSSFANILESEARWQRVQSANDFLADVANDTLPEYAWFTPDMWNDGHYLMGTHGEPAERAPALVDQQAHWLSYFFGLLDFPGPDSKLPKGTLVVVTYDESDFEADWDAGKKYTYDGPNQIYTVLLGDMIGPGAESEGYNHYSLIKTVEQNFGLGSLGKNDQDANWFRFLWGRRFHWEEPVDTPVETAEHLALATLGETAYLVHADGQGALHWRTFDGHTWSAELPVGQTTHGPIALASCGDELVLVHATNAGLSSVGFNAQGGWSGKPVTVVESATGAIALAACDEGARLMVAWADADQGLRSLSYAEGAWSSEPESVRHVTDGDACLSVIGPSLYLIAKQAGTDGIQVVSRNEAPFNVVTVAEDSYSGPYDDTTQGLWSPSAFPVAHFSHMASPKTPGEEEPVTQPYSGRAPLAVATLDGVIHLAHRGADDDAVMTETFSISGIMTPKLRVSYNSREDTTTSNGYGTLAEAGWSTQESIDGVSSAAGGAMAMTRLGDAMLLVFQPKEGGPVRLARGEYS